MVIDEKFTDLFMDPKAAQNRGLGLLLLLYCSPLLLLLAIAVRLDTGGSPFELEALTAASVWRFRTTRRGDNTETAIGGFLRRSRLDQLPRLANVARGDITIMDALR